jgi:hypothetical protein
MYTRGSWLSFTSSCTARVTPGLLPVLAHFPVNMTVTPERGLRVFLGPTSADGGASECIQDRGFADVWHADAQDANGRLAWPGQFKKAGENGHDTRVMLLPAVCEHIGNALLLVK